MLKKILKNFKNLRRNKKILFLLYGGIKKNYSSIKEE